ncbi:MAG: protoporphyrinogen oxidase, partial [Mycobacteriales bacterium]
RLGGKLHTADLAGLPVESGADAFLARVPEGTALARRVGLGDELISPAATEASVLTRGRLRPLPEQTVLGIPTRMAPLRRTRVLSAPALARAAAERLLPARRVEAPVSVGEWVGARFGRGVVDALVDPLLGGVYAGHADRLDLDATLPDVARVARAHGRVLGRLRPPRAPGTPVFQSVRGGLTRLVDAVARTARDHGATLETGARVVALERVGRGWRVTLAGGRAVVAEAVIVSTPAFTSARLLGEVAPQAAALLGSVEYASVGIVSLALPWTSAVAPATQSGFLVAATEPFAVKAGTWMSAKWPSPASGRDLALVRCSVGRAADDAALGLEDSELVARVCADLAAITGEPVAPRGARVTRWLDALPQYSVAHAARMASVQAAVSPLGGLALAGAAYDGVGIPACIRSAGHAVARVREHLGATIGSPAEGIAADG